MSYFPAFLRTSGRLARRAAASARLITSIGLAAAAACASAQTVPKGTWDAYAKGAFGPVVNWPLIPIHAALLPDGRVMSYGTDLTGAQTGLFQYDIWNGAQGTGTNSHLVLPNTTGTDLFCSAQVLVPANGAVLLTGGDSTVNGVRNYSVNDVNFFSYDGNALYAGPQKMAALRWYPSLVTLATGDVVVLGGRADPQTPAPTPELYNPTTGWRSLNGATNQDAYGINNWSYPRAWQAPNGQVFILTVWGGSYYLDPTGDGSVTRTSLTLGEAHPYLPSVMYAPGKILALRKNNLAYVLDINGMTPTSKATAGVGQDRYNATATVLPDGKVLVSGGSMVENQANGVAYSVKLWNPSSGTWTTGATEKQMRLYHSISLLLPNGSVLTGGGGAPGPQTNLNAEIYYPPYLYRKDFSGSPATRPVITSAPQYLTWGKSFSFTTDSAITRATLMKLGSVTHTVDFEQRFVELALSGTGTTRTAVAPANGNIAPPGFYMLFVLNASGTPSVAKIVRLGS